MATLYISQCGRLVVTLLVAFRQDLQVQSNISRNNRNTFFIFTMSTRGVPVWISINTSSYLRTIYEKMSLENNVSEMFHFDTCIMDMSIIWNSLVTKAELYLFTWDLSLTIRIHTQFDESAFSYNSPNIELLKNKLRLICYAYYTTGHDSCY